MAVAQAQDKVKELMDKLEQSGKEVKIGIHPVAGRMPGHMNVLLAEVGIDYDKLYDMETINPEFEKTDLTIVVGACDVVNPSANTAEGTPIYQTHNRVQSRRKARLFRCGELSILYGKRDDYLGQCLRNRSHNHTGL